MNTNALKSFAKAARIQLLDAVGKQILYWGFTQKGEVVNEPSATQGGFVHRGEVYNDTTVLPKWQRLKEKITAKKEAFKDVAEEAAYTWFNRLIAIKVLEENGFIDPFLQFADDTQSPIALQNAKAGKHTVTHPTLKANLQKALLDSDEEKAFSILLINYCNQHPMLNQVFGRVNDYTELLIPQNLLSIDGFLVALNTEIAEEDFKEVELIGWLYQFYISDKKDEVFKGFKANKKARPEDIPAATQIFTPKWIVNYMVENTVGKIYLDFEEDSDLKDQMKYLVENETEGKGKLIDDIEQLTLIDPACGSGHILVTGFEWLYKMYREQGYTAKNAIESILKNNLFGLDIDDRAMQLARFAVLLKAAQQLQQVDASQAVVLMNNPLDVIPHIYAFPESVGFTSEEVALFTQNQHVQEVYKAFEALREGKNIGSALKISLSDAAREVLIAQYYAWNQKDKQGTLDIEEIGVWYKLKSYIEVALVLSKKYAAVVANPPYMGQKSMNGELKDYVNAHYPMTKADLFAVFMEVCLALNRSNGLMGMINQHSWMFLSSFENYRTHLLLNQTIQSMLHLGPRAFEELSGEVVQSTAFVLENRTSKNAKASYYRLVDYKSNNEKEEQFLKGNNFYPNIPQTNFDKIPGSPIAYWASEKIINIYENYHLLKDYLTPSNGIQTGNNEVFTKNIWEVSKVKHNTKWFFYAKGGAKRKWYGNLDLFVNWENEGKEIISQSNSCLRGKEFYFKSGITWSDIASQGISFRFLPNGCLFDAKGPSAFGDNSNYFLGLLNTKFVSNLSLILNPTLSFQIGEFKKIPIIKSESFNESLVHDNLNISKKDWDSRETSWDFEQSPLLGIREKGEGNSVSLKAAYEAWVAEVSQDFFQLHANEEELNRIFIDIYGLQDELTPDVALKDITILQDELKAEDLEALEIVYREQGLLGNSGEGKGNGENSNHSSLAPNRLKLPIQANVVMQQFISYLVGTLLGRYRLGRKGLHIAHPNPTDEELSEYLVIGGKGFGYKEQEAIFNYIHHEHPEFSRSIGLAKSYESGDRSLPTHAAVSEGGNVWTKQSNQESDNFGTEQYSGGTSARNQGISSVSQNSEGFTGGSGNTVGDSTSTELSSGNGFSATSTTNNGIEQDAEWIKQQAEELIANYSTHGSNPTSLNPNPLTLFTFKIDEDAIIPLMGSACAFPDDAVKRVDDIIHRIWGDASHTENLNFINQCLGMDYEKWMTEQFWAYHISGTMYKKKPIYWMFCSNPKSPQKSAFRVLVYMHRMDAYTVQKILRNYLHPHIEYVKGKYEEMHANEANLSRQELRVYENLAKQISELKEYEQKLKEVANQQITFDLDDGVKVNYAKFEGVVAVIK